MPAKRIIIQSKAHPTAPWFRYVLWADVPAGNQIAYRNPLAASAYENATPAEVQAIRDGTVAETTGVYQTDDSSQANMQAALQTAWTEWQAQVTAINAWNTYGMYWNSSAAWQPTTGVPMCSVKETLEGLPAYVALTPVSAFGANKFQFVLFNGMAAATGQAVVVKVRLLVFIPGVAVVTGVASSAWTLQRRVAPSTNPSGVGSIAPQPLDSAMALPAGISAFNAPGTAPAGGTVQTFYPFMPQADEAKLSTLDAPTFSTLTPFGGQTIYSASALTPARPLTCRAGETIEVVQSATGGTGNGQILCVFTVG